MCPRDVLSGSATDLAEDPRDSRAQVGYLRAQISPCRPRIFRRTEPSQFSAELGGVGAGFVLAQGIRPGRAEVLQDLGTRMVSAVPAFRDRYAVASASTRQPRPNSNRKVWSISAMSRRGPGVGFLQHDRTQVILLRQRGRTAECRRRSRAGQTLLPWQPRRTTSRVAAVPKRTPPERRGAGGDFGTRRASGQIGGTLTTGSVELQGRCGAAKALPTRTIAVLLRPHCRCSGVKRLSAQLPVAVFLNQV